jgi:hypothetical protein
MKLPCFAGDQSWIKLGDRLLSGQSWPITAALASAAAVAAGFAAP